MKVWPLFLGASSLICFVHVLMPYLDIESPFIEWAKIMKYTLENSHYLDAYIIGIWPLFLVLLFIYSLWVPLANGIKSAA